MLVNVLKKGERHYFSDVSRPNEDFTYSRMAEWCMLHVPPREYRELVEALEGFWRTLASSREACAACANGRLEYYTGHSNGCCSDCPNLSDRGCVAKPVGCALHGCEGLHQAAGKTAIEALEEVALGRIKALWEKEKLAWYAPACYASAYYRDCNHNWGAPALAELASIAEQVRQLTAQNAKRKQNRFRREMLVRIEGAR